MQFQHFQDRNILDKGINTFCTVNTCPAQLIPTFRVKEFEILALLTKSYQTTFQTQWPLLLQYTADASHIKYCSYICNLELAGMFSFRNWDFETFKVFI